MSDQIGGIDGLSSQSGSQVKHHHHHHHHGHHHHKAGEAAGANQAANIPGITTGGANGVTDTGAANQANKVFGTET